MYKKLSMLVIIIVFSIGCGSMPPPTLNDEITDFDQNESESNPKLTETSEISESYTEKDRFLTYQANYRIKSLYPDSIHKQVVKITEDYEGYVLEATKEKTTIRIVSKYLAQVIEDIESLGEVIEKNIEGNDITEEFYDLEYRLENAENRRAKYVELMNKAQNLNEMKLYEKEIERINNDIDILMGKLNSLKHRINYATITVETSPGIKAGPVGWVIAKLVTGVKDLFIK